MTNTQFTHYRREGGNTYFTDRSVETLTPEQRNAQVGFERSFTQGRGFNPSTPDIKDYLDLMIFLAQKESLFGNSAYEFITKAERAKRLATKAPSLLGTALTSLLGTSLTNATTQEARKTLEKVLDEMEAIRRDGDVIRIVKEERKGKSLSELEYISSIDPSLFSILSLPKDKGSLDPLREFINPDMIDDMIYKKIINKLTIE